MELPVSLDNICRTCLSEKSAELFCLLDGADGCSLAEILSNCCDVQVAEDAPTRICAGCRMKLIAFYEFKKTCMQNDILLRTVLVKNSPSLGNKENVSPTAGKAIEESRCVEPNISCSKTTGHIEQDPDAENPSAFTPYVCKRCGKCFEKPKNLYRHEKIHNGQKPYLCATCGKRFAQSNNLQAHMRTHSGARPYACTECSKSFAQWSTLRTHLVTHTGERPFVCTVCGKTFARRNALTKHAHTHRPERKYACAVCGKRFKTASERTQHTAIHTGEKRHVCGTCGKCFNRASNLTVHRKIHVWPTVRPVVRPKQPR